MNATASLKLQDFFISPISKLKAYFRTAVAKPENYIQQIDLGEDLKYAVLISLIASVLSSLYAMAALPIPQAVFLFINLVVTIFMVSAVQYLVALVAKAQIDYQGCLNLYTHLSVLVFPLTLASSFVPVLNIGSVLITLYASYLCLVKRCHADENTVKIIYLCFAIFSLGSYLKYLTL